MTQISESRTRELLQWLDDQAGDHTNLFEQMARYRDAAALPRRSYCPPRANRRGATAYVAARANRSTRFATSSRCFRRFSSCRFFSVADRRRSAVTVRID